jgi:hypothetical protein
MATSTTTKTAADKAQAEAAAKAALAKKREEAALAAKIEEYRRDVPPGIGEVEAELRAQIDELKRKPPVHLYAAIHAAQAKIETVRKNGENPHFKSKYATLDEVWETVRKAVNDAGLIVFCTVENGTCSTVEHEEKVFNSATKKWEVVSVRKEMVTARIVTHLAEVKSGEEITCAFPFSVPIGDPQKVGSAMTYARRYTLTALLEIVTGDGADDDGEAAANHTPATKNPSASAAADALGF